MKTPRCFSLLALAAVLGAALITPPQTLARTKADPAPALQVSVDVPPMWQSFLEDDVAEAFCVRISDTFKQAGFKGDIRQLRRADEARPDIPLLEVNLIEWRISRVGNVDCTFSAALKSGDTIHNLGLFNGTSLQWISTGSHRWALDRGLEDSAQSALKDLYKKLTKENLLPAPTPAAK